MANIAVTITVPGEMLSKIEGLIEKGRFFSKSDFFKEAGWKFLGEEDGVET